MGMQTKVAYRTSEQTDLGVTKVNFNDLNQLTDTVGGGAIRSGAVSF